LWDGLVGWWPLQEGGGSTAFDVSGYGRDGTLTNMDPATDWVVGEKGKALDFDGTNDLVQTTFSPEGIIEEDGATGCYQNHTVCGWFRWASGTAEILWTWNPVGGSAGGIMVVATGFTIYSGNDVAALGILTFGWTPDTEWHHFAYRKTIRGVASELYLDGTPLSVVADSGSPNPNPANFIIGGRVQATTCWTGDLSLFSVYNRVITSSEIAQLYADPWGMGRVRPRVFKAAAAPVGVAPTSVLYGPLVGPLGGPI